MPYMKDTLIRPRHYDSTIKVKLKKMMDEMRPNNRAKDLETKLQRVTNTKTLKENIAKVLEFDRECEQNGHKVASRYSALVTLHCLCQFASKKPFSQVTKADIIDFLSASKNRKFEDKRYRARANPKNVERQLANSTMNLIKLRVKRFFQWLYGMEKGKYPENVRWIELKTVRGDHELTPEDLPTAEEVKRMIECTENPRDRALISLMAESGARVGEISTTRLNNISWNDNGFILTIRRKRSKSKFGRRIPLCACAEDIKCWVNDYHPFKNDPEAPLFTSFADRRTPKTNLKADGIAAVIRRVAIRAGLEERIHMHPHKFRHLRASQLAELSWNEPMLKQFFGWSKTSKMPATYIHMSQKSMNNRYYQMYGKAGPEEAEQQTLEEPRTCSKCGIQNPNGYRFCFRCNAVLDKEKQKRIEDRKEAENLLEFIARNPKLSEKLSRLLQEAIEKRKCEHPSSTLIPEQG